MIRPSILRTIKLTTRPPIALGSDISRDLPDPRRGEVGLEVHRLGSTSAAAHEPMRSKRSCELARHLCDRCDSPRDSVLWSSEAGDPAPAGSTRRGASAPPLPMD